jgi:uncharacterized protein (DUF1697 family)
MKYIALIRGINVGGKNSVSMAQLKQSFETSGFKNVSTYINSGNVIFESHETDTAKLVEECERVLQESFGVTTRIAVILASELHDALEQVPSWWGSEEGIKHNTIFIIAPADVKQIMREVGEIKPEYEKVAQYKNIIFWSAPLKTFSRSRWAKIVGTPAYKDITIRNANTTRKLRELTSL